MSGTAKWETVARKSNPPDYLERIRVPGGWLYRVQVDNGTDDGWSLAMCFVPDPTGRGLSG
jgi:hypothetical protein